VDTEYIVLANDSVQSDNLLGYKSCGQFKLLVVADCVRFASSGIHVRAKQKLSAKQNQLAKPKLFMDSDDPKKTASKKFSEPKLSHVSIETEQSASKPDVHQSIANEMD
jgi:hypothetical protein